MTINPENKIFYLNKDKQKLFDALDYLKKEIESGKITSLALAMTCVDDYNLNIICDTENACPINLLGEIRLLERDVIDCLCQTRRQPRWEFCE